VNRICKYEESNQQIVVFGKRIYSGIKINHRNVT